jgi:hypothetical protein
MLRMTGEASDGFKPSIGHTANQLIGYRKVAGQL